MDRARRAIRIAGAVTATLLLAACSANHHSIFRYKRLDAGGAALVTVDAKQRAILIGSESTSTTQDQKTSTVNIRKFCSEPSPDVFSVIAQALSAGGTLSKSADPKAVEMALDAAFSSAEQGATIPRTQTVNMLRELMFRTCERYLNGGIGSLELPIQAARDQRLIVSILAIESLTGAVTPKPLVIGAHANASTGASGPEAAVRLDNAYRDSQGKAAAQQARQTEYDSITTDGKHCEQIAEAVTKKEEDNLSQELKDKRAKCESATSALVSAKKEAAGSAAHYATLKDAAAGGGLAMAASTDLMTPTADGGIDRAHDASIGQVAKTVKTIVLANINQNEFDFLCMKVLDPREQGKLDRSLTDDKTGIQETCAEYVRSKIEQSIAISNVMASTIAEESTARQARQSALFETFWARISKDGKKPDAASHATFKSVNSWWPDCFQVGGNKQSYADCFQTLESWKQQSLTR
jgi:hypothetical protein